MHACRITNSCVFTNVFIVIASGSYLEKKIQLIHSAYKALAPGGVLVAIEALIDDARRENVFGLLMSLNMLIEFGDAFDYSGADFRGWCSEVGFQPFEVMHLAGASSAAIAYK